MDKRPSLGVIIAITLGTTIVAVLATEMSYGQKEIFIEPRNKKAPTAITGDNVYVAWWSNKTGNDEVLFRASNDKGQTFGDKINLSNSSDAASSRVEIDSNANSVVVTWWETNDTDDIPVMRVSDDNGKTFGPLLKLGVNGTIGNSEE